MKPTVWLWPKAQRAVIPCHSASHRNGAVSTRSTGRQFAGKRSNMNRPRCRCGGGRREGANGEKLFQGRRVIAHEGKRDVMTTVPRVTPFLFTGALDRPKPDRYSRRMSFRVSFCASYS